MIRMQKILVHLYIILTVSFFTLTSYGQNPSGKIDLRQAEQFFQTHFDSLASVDGDSKREAVNREILKKFRHILKHEKTFQYPFDSVSHAGILESPDGKVKIYNWNVPYEAGYHVFHCFLQYHTGDSILTFELNDESEKIENPEDSVLDENNWYGSLYYRIIPKKGRFGETYYTLLGYDPNDYLTNKKVIDVLQFNKNNEPVFGATIFKNQRTVTKRIIFEYAEFATMTLQYHEEKDMIVYDHLSPSQPKYEGQYEFYGPDFSYDGLRFENGIWNTYFDLDLRLNEINLDD